MKLIGPFKQIVTLANLSLRGKLSDDQLEIVNNGGILVDNGKIKAVGDFEILRSVILNGNEKSQIEFTDGEQICLPAFTDSHTHICLAEIALMILR